MKFRIIHETSYHFTSKVFLEPHYLRFKPKITPFCNPESFKIQISPRPTGIFEQLDIENNRIHMCWFDGEHLELNVRAESVVNTITYNPFNFILYPSTYLNLPFAYDVTLKELLQPSLNITDISDPLLRYGEQIRKEVDFNTVQFITNLTRKIFKDFKVETRYEGDPFAPDKTFEFKKGSCRDITWMQIQLLRHMGVASRFVSGYFYIDADDPEYELHAWLEVFLPGAGWIGFDPSHGIATSHTHIPVASSAQYEKTMPVTGSIRGSASPELSTNLSIEVVE